MGKKGKLRFRETFDLSPEEQLKMLNMFEVKANSNESNNMDSVYSDEGPLPMDGDSFDKLVETAVGAKLSPESNEENEENKDEVIEEDKDIKSASVKIDNDEILRTITTEWDEDNETFFMSGLYGDGISMYLDNLKTFVNDINNEYSLIENITNEVFDRLILSIIPEAVISERVFDENIMSAISSLDECFRFYRKSVNGNNYILCYTLDEDVISDFADMIDHFSSAEKIFSLLVKISSITKNKDITFGLRDNILMKVESDYDSRNDFMNRIYNHESTVYIDNNVKTSRIEIKNIDDTLYKYDEILTRIASNINGEEKESESAEEADED